MSESTPINVQAFQPFEGGKGKRLAVTTSTARVEIPGTQAPADPRLLRLLVTNGGQSSVFICLGRSDVVATLDCLEVLPGCAYLLSPPDVAQSSVWLAAISEDDTTNIQVCAGNGT